MGTETNNIKPENETFASANVSPPHEGEPDYLENDDISQILNGNKAITGKAVWSANSAAVMQREDANQRQRAEEKHETESREMRELAHLAEWNAQKTNFGGVEMTNAEAQAALQHIIHREDEYADRAVREGRIREDEKEEYKRTAERMRELRERQGRGTATDAEKAELERLQHSSIGQAVGHDVGEHVQQAHEAEVSASTKAENAKAELRTGLSAAPTAALFQSAPDINGHFTGAVVASNIAQNEPDIPPPAATIRSVNQVRFVPE